MDVKLVWGRSVTTAVDCLLIMHMSIIQNKRKPIMFSLIKMIIFLCSMLVQIKSLRQNSRKHGIECGFELNLWCDISQMLMVTTAKQGCMKRKHKYLWRFRCLLNVHVYSPLLMPSFGEFDFNCESELVDVFCGEILIEMSISINSRDKAPWPVS